MIDIRRVVAAILVVGLTLGGANPTLLAASVNGPRATAESATLIAAKDSRFATDLGFVPSGQATFELLNRYGVTEMRLFVDPTVDSSSIQALPQELQGRINFLKEQIRTSASRRGSLTPAEQRLSTYIKITEARANEERHRLIRSLPVSIQRQNVYGGTYAYYIVDGKARVRRFTPTPLADSLHTVADPDGSTGKGLDFEPCPSDEYPEDECATQQDHDDFAIFLADSFDELDIVEASIAETDEGIALYCQANPWYCDDSTDIESPDSSTTHSAAPPCWNEMVEAGLALGAGIAGAGGAHYTLSTTVKLGVFKMGLLWLGTATVVVGAAYFAALYWNCRQALPTAPMPAEEPVAGFRSVMSYW